MRPKPMIEIGAKPILWHIMKIYAAHGITEFVVCLGYKGYVIKEFFANYYLHACDVTFDLARNAVEVHQSTAEPWRVTLVDTGDDDDDRRPARARAATTSRDDDVLPHLRRRRRRRRHHARWSTFHREQGTIATVTAVQPPGRFGALEIDGDARHGLRREAARRRRLDQRRLLRALARGRALPRRRRRRSGSASRSRGSRATGELSVYQHEGFWQPMDTQRDMRQLQALWESGDAPWTAAWR